MECDEKVWLSKVSGKCVEASFINAVACIKELKVAQSAKEVLEKRNIKFVNLKPLGIVVHQLSRLETQKSFPELRNAMKLKDKTAFQILTKL